MQQITVELSRTGATATSTHIRSHGVIIDRPESNGGGNAGPMGGEIFLASIGGCFMSTLIAAAKAREISVNDATCAVTGTFLDNPRRFGIVDVTVSCAECQPDELDHLVQVAEKGCIVLNTLRGGLNVKVTAQSILSA